MTFTRLLLANLFFYRRTNIAVVLGVAAATSVLVGALLVGDSVRFSLRKLALDRLGRIDEMLVADRFFREELAREIRDNADFKNDWSQIEPALIFPSASLEHTHQGANNTQHLRRAADVLAIGCQPSFWQFSDPAVRPARDLADDEIALNQTLADELGVEVGQSVTLRFSKLSQVPADSPLGRKTGRVQGLPNLKVAAILPAASLAQFSLHPQQGSARVAFVPLATMQDALQQKGKVNGLVVAGNNPQQPPDAQASAKLQQMLHPDLADYGVTVHHVRRTFSELDPPDVIFDYYQLTSDRMMISPEMERATLAAWKAYAPQRILTYLANTIALAAPNENKDTADNKSGIPYSTVTALDSQLPIGAGDALASIAPGKIVLTSWAADDLGAKTGDKIRLDFYEPESTHGDEVETSAEFEVQAIIRLTEPTQPYTRRKPAVYADRPTIANDPDFTPQVPGITDQESIADWDSPFPFDQSRVRPQDDEYWENHRTTPKAYISYEDGEKYWGSRFGEATSIRINAQGNDKLSAESLSAELLQYLRENKLSMGLEIQPVKRQAIAASSGTTPFDVLFLALSMFVIAAALVLVWLLYRLGVEQRVAEQGLLRSLGWSLSTLLRLYLVEGISLAAIGTLIGTLLGIAYAWVMIVGLRTWWIGAVTSPFLELHTTIFSLVLGATLGLLTAAVTVWLGLRGMRNMAVRDLLSGRTSSPAVTSANANKRSWTKFVAPILLLTAAGLLAVAFFMQGEAQGGAALGAGAALLAAWMIKIRQRLSGVTASVQPQPLHSLGEFALRNAGRNPTRSMATMSLMASAVFMIVAVSAFRLAPSAEGTGGFDYLAESAEPIVHDLNSSAGREALLGDDAFKLGKSQIYAFRLQPGDDASCRNLYRPSQPRVLGVTPAFVHHYDDPKATAFRWSASAAQGEQTKNPWQLLLPPDDAASKSSEKQPPTIPVVIDQNTAMYSLRLYQGIGEEFDVTYETGPTVRFRVVGLLAESLLQGSLLISEADFERLFPDRSGYRFFLIQPDNSQFQTQPDEVASHASPIIDLLEDDLGDEGFDAGDAKKRLVDLFAVQNTYISTFQTLGGLGLLLGTFGLAAVQLRNILERQSELALLRSVGFDQPHLLSLVLKENALLLVGGLVTGTLAALLALLPQLITGGASPPWFDLAVTLGIVAAVGSIVSWWAANAIQKVPVIAALRGE